MRLSKDSRQRSCCTSVTGAKLCVSILKRAKRQESQKEAYFFKTKQRIIPALVAILWDVKINKSNKDMKKKKWSVSESSAHGKIK